MLTIKNLHVIDILDKRLFFVCIIPNFSILKLQYKQRPKTYFTSVTRSIIKNIYLF